MNNYYTKLRNIQMIISLLKQHNIRKPRNLKNTHANTHASKTNTGVQYLSLLKNYTWQYRRTYQNPNNITRVKFEDIERVIKEKGYLWIVYDEEKLNIESNAKADSIVLDVSAARSAKSSGANSKGFEPSIISSRENSLYSASNSPW